MIIHASAKFTDHLRCAVSVPNRDHIQRAKIDRWSVDVFRARAVGNCALMMNGVSLSTVVVQRVEDD